MTDDEKLIIQSLYEAIHDLNQDMEQLRLSEWWGPDCWAAMWRNAAPNNPRTIRRGHQREDAAFATLIALGIGEGAPDTSLQPEGGTNMMGIGVAKHLNKLRERASCAKAGVKCLYSPDGDFEGTSELINCVRSYAAAGLDAEIRAAARESRECEEHSPACGPEERNSIAQWKRIRDDKHNSLTQKIIEAAQPALEAIYARWVAEYETYRLACEQGVAVAPKT